MEGARALMEELAQAQVEAVIPSKANRKQPRIHGEHLDQRRHLVENFFARLKRYRPIATRYDKRAHVFLGAIHLAVFIIWLI